MSKQSVADIIADILHNVGVPRIYGIVGGSLNGLTDSLRRNRTIDWVMSVMKNPRHSQRGRRRI
jgi:pyruvate dehydrogenase (quinone)